MSEAWLYKGNALTLTSKDCPKNKDHYFGYLYVLELSNGYTKVGITRCPKERVDNLRRNLRSSGIELQRLWVSCGHINFENNEKACHAHLSSFEKDGEFFKCDPVVAVGYAQELPQQTVIGQEQIDAAANAAQRFDGLLSALAQISQTPRMGPSQ